MDNRSVFGDRRRGKVEESGKGDGRSGSKSGEDFGDRGGEHAAPVSNHCPMSRGNAKPSLVVVSEVIGALLMILPSVLHGITPDLFLGEGGCRHSSSSGVSPAAVLLDQAIHHVVRVRGGRWGRYRCGGRRGGGGTRGDKDRGGWARHSGERQGEVAKGCWRYGGCGGPSLYPRSSSCSGVRSHVFLEDFRGMEVFVIDPGVVRMWVALPMHEVLQLTSSPVSPGIQDGFDLVLLFTIDDRRWACERRAVCLHLLIWKEKVDVKDIVDLHRWGESEFVGDRTDLLRDWEGPISFWGELLIPRDREVPSFEPYLVSFFHLRSFLIVSSVLDVGQQFLGRLPRLGQELKSCFCCRRGGLEVFQDHLRF